MGNTMGKEGTMIVRGLALALSLGGCGSDDGRPANDPDASAGGGGVGASGGSSGTGASSGSGGAAGSGGVGECSPGDKQCDALVPQTCSVNGAWLDGAPCPYVCLTGSCAGVCAPDSKQCSGNTPQTCDAGGQWLSGTPCPNVCAVGSCTGACVPGTKQCSDLVPQTCNNSGTWQDGAACPYVCNNGMCTGVCTPGSGQCNGLVPQTCDAGGQWQTGTACPYVCSSGACTGVCTPGATQCSGNGLQTCSASGQWGTAVACTTQACVSGACTGVCTPGATQCLGNGVQTCSATGQWGTAVACGSSTPQCSAGTCGTPLSCQSLSSNCGASSNESCCTSPLVTGGTYNRSNDASYPATVSSFRLDKYEVTVGRFRKFVDAVVAGWLPGAGSGKHTHLNGGSGLSNNSGSSSYEPGWDTAWNAHLHGSKAIWDGSTSLACSSGYQTWTASAGNTTVERRPINCVNWYQAHAFCIWDGGFLPSEAEWNYAAAGGSAQRTYPWGSTAPGADANLAVYGCYYNGTGPGTCTGVTNLAPVGSVPAGNGLYGQSDLAGNVWEWNLDWYVSPYATPCNDCAYLPTTSFNRVFRGGGFSWEASYVLSSYRSNLNPPGRGGGSGARCARTP